MQKLSILVLSLVFAAGCGTALDTGAKFRKEKDQRIETQKELYATQQRERELKELLGSVTTTANHVWAWRSNSSLRDYGAARATCQEIGFDLPTDEQLVEAESHERIASAIALDGIGTDVFVRDREERLAFTILCVMDRSPH